MTLRMSFIIVTLAVGTRFAFAAGPEQAAPRLIEVSLTRTGNSDDTGPHDELILRSNGTAYYKGLKNVERKGLFEGTVRNDGFEHTLPLLEKMYAALRGKPHSTGKPTK